MDFQELHVRAREARAGTKAGAETAGLQTTRRSHQQIERGGPNEGYIYEGER